MKIWWIQFQIKGYPGFDFTYLYWVVCLIHALPYTCIEKYCWYKYEVVQCLSKKQFLEVFRLLCQLHSKTNSCVFEAIGIIFAINQHTFFWSGFVIFTNAISKWNPIPKKIRAYILCRYIWSICFVQLYINCNMPHLTTLLQVSKSTCFYFVLSISVM